jgi:type IV secretory pathway VirB3-like protein
VAGIKRALAAVNPMMMRVSFVVSDSLFIFVIVVIILEFLPAKE